MNIKADSLCSFGDDMEDICHIYMNPDKERMQDMFITIHMMEYGVRSEEHTPKYTNVTMLYSDPITPEPLLIETE